MLNDLARPTRLMVAGQLLPVAVFLGAMSGMVGADGAEGLGVALGLVAGAVVVMLGWLVGVLVWLRVADRRLKRDLARGSEEILRGAVRAVPAPGRLLRHRGAQGPGFVADAAGPLPGPTSVIVATVLAPEGPRRVGALVPAGLGLQRRDAPVALLLHPHDRETAVVETRVGAEQLAAVDHDPRWATERLPTDRSVVGGYAGLLGAALLAAVVGFAGAWLVVALAAGRLV